MNSSVEAPAVRRGQDTGAKHDVARARSVLAYSPLFAVFHPTTSEKH